MPISSGLCRNTRLKNRLTSLSFIPAFSCISGNLTPKHHCRHASKNSA
ncbi:hypothetical protein [Moraxella lacunata]